MDVPEGHLTESVLQKFSVNVSQMVSLCWRQVFCSKLGSAGCEGNDLDEQTTASLPLRWRQRRGIIRFNSCVCGTILFVEYLN